MAERARILVVDELSGVTIILSDGEYDETTAVCTVQVNGHSVVYLEYSRIARGLMLALQGIMGIIGKNAVQWEPYRTILEPYRNINEAMHEYIYTIDDISVIEKQILEDYYEGL
jgi:hypothetical protein